MIIMEIRISGKNTPHPGYKDLSAWIKKTKDGRNVLIMNLGELVISMYPYDKNCIREFSKNLKEIID